MPQTQLERVLALLTVAGAAALVLLLLTNWESLRGSASVSDAVATQSQAPQETTRAPVTTAPATTAPARTAPVTTARATTTAAASAAPARVLSIAAVDGPTWLEVRAGEATGDELFFGMLPQGEEEVFRRLPVWVRVGAVESVTVSLGGSAVASLPSSSNGVTEFVVSDEGVSAANAG